VYVDDAGSGPPIVAIHGLGGGAYFFGGLARRLEDEFRVISIDLPGTGRSPATVYSMESWVADLGRVVAERVKTPVVLLGHSMGTIIALHAWAAWPEHIRGLVFVGGLPRVRPFIHDRLSKRIEALTGVRELTGWGRQVSPGVFSQRMLHEHPEVVASFERLFEVNSVDTYIRCCRILLGANAEAIVPNVRIRSLAITGEDDQYAPPADVVAFARSIPSQPAVETFPNCGHLPFLEVPDRFATVVRAFLRTC